jgi:hypothetical protein
MISALIGWAVAINLAQAIPEGEPARAASSSSRVWTTLEFVPTDTRPQRLPKPVKFFLVQNVQPNGQVKTRPCSRMPRVKVDESVDPKIIVPQPPDTPKARKRILGEEMPTCATR